MAFTNMCLKDLNLPFFIRKPLRSLYILGLSLLLFSCGSSKEASESRKGDKPEQEKLSTGESDHEKYTPGWYLDKYKLFAIKEMKRTGIPASITLAQGMLESSYGKSRLAKEGKNHFGIKCHRGNWEGGKMFLEDDAPNECFRTYKSVLQSYHDHSEFLKSGHRYNELFKLKPTQYKKWAKGLKKAGYATNPRYDDLLIRIIERYDLHYYDQFHDKPYKTDDNQQLASKSGQSKEESKTEESGSKINGLRAIEVSAGQNLKDIANEHDIKKSDLIRFNDLQEVKYLKPGEILYLEPKKDKPARSYHVVEKDESLWDISQQYGVKLEKLRKRNRLGKNAEPAVGSRVFLRERRYSRIALRENPLPHHSRKKGEAKSSIKVRPPQNSISQASGQNPDFHIVEEGETMQSIAQQYNMPVAILYKKNRMESGEQPAKGAQIHLKERRYVSPELRENPALTKAGNNEEMAGKKEKQEAKQVNKDPEPSISSSPDGASEEPDSQASKENNTLNNLPNQQSTDEADKKEPKPEETEKSNRRSKASDQKFTHVVKNGETLYGIATKYGVGVSQIKKWNDLTSNSIQPGQSLVVKKVEGNNDKADEDKQENESTSSSSDKASEKNIYHKVQEGETLYGISVKYDVPVSRIKDLNNMKSNNLAIGQRLRIRSAGSKASQSKKSKEKREYHKVEKGETLFGISQKYDISVKKLKQINDLQSNNLFIDQKLYLE